ncbi:MAG: hypothetical protein F4X15_03250 [Gemmatimonadetes bacterium]|nr:hypothetical protein [Gemmatimonadota bacterium]MYC90464.1 hypothetical protein [Gemmatimonadota bacterium]
MMATKWLRTRFALLACALSAACAQQDPGSQSDNLTTTFDTVGGVVHATNTGTPPEWRLAPVVSIGPRTLTDEGGPEEFGWVTAVALGPDGHVFVADTRNHEVRVFGLDGAHQRTFGREGEGPGEFRSLYSLAWVGDRLLTFDPHLGRLGGFTAEGEWLGQRRTVAGLSGSPADIRLYPVGANEVFRFAYGPERGSHWVGHDGGGDTGDTIPRLTVEPEELPGGGTPIICQWGGGIISFFEHPFGTRFVQHPGAGGITYAAWGYDYRVVVTEPGGDTLRVIRRTLPEEPISDEEWAAGNVEFDEFRRETSDADCDRRGFTRPDRKSFIQQIFVAPDGNLWVEVIRSAGNRWEFFDTEGRLLGSVPVVPHKDRTVPVFRGDYLATIRQDELDLDHVDVWRPERVKVTEDEPMR